MNTANILDIDLPDDPYSLAERMNVRQKEFLLSLQLSLLYSREYLLSTMTGLCEVLGSPVRV